LTGSLEDNSDNPSTLQLTIGSNWWGCTAGANGGVGCAATYPTTGANAVNTSTVTPCTNSTCTSSAVSTPIIDLRSSGRATIFATEIIE